MSTGPRIPLARAVAAAQAVMALWGMTAPSCQIVGSVRRRKPDVGDIEIIAPLPELEPFDPFDPRPAEETRRITEEEDDLYRRIRATTESEPDLFNPNPPPPKARALEGLRPGFLETTLEVMLTNILPAPTSVPPSSTSASSSEGCPVKIQIFRYTPGDKGNRGWVELRTTGPREFGIDFLVGWKKRYGIVGDGKASIDGHLVDSYKRRVPVPTEDDCFRIVGRGPIPPEQRDEYAARAAAINASEREQVMR